MYMDMDMDMDVNVHVYVCMYVWASNPKHVDDCSWYDESVVSQLFQRLHVQKGDSSHSMCLILMTV